VLDGDARFCDTCGAPVGAPSPADGRGGARKVVTVVFADLAGSTALAERMDPESVRAAMQRYYALIREAVETHDGRIVKFIGDGVMAVFGVPETREDDTRNALRAGLAMHEAFASLASDVVHDRGATVGLRVGVNTGEVVVGDDDDDVVGDAVNLAARLERAVPAGGVLVGESTWRLTRGTAVFGDERVLHVAGKSDAVRAWQLVSVDRDTVELRTELVGRSSELELLRSMFDNAVATNSSKLVTIIGSPGVGKTRLAAELERSLGEATILVARCAQELGAPLAPIAEMLHASVDGSAADPSATVERLGALLTDDGDRDRVLRAVAAVLGIGDATPEESFWALRRLIEQRTRNDPVVLVVDDLQWGETVLIDLVEHLAEWTRGSLLLVVTARPELREIRGALTDGARHTVIALEGLDGDATGALACELLGATSLPGELLARLPASTGGNPLFLSELLRMLVDDGVLRAETDGGWMLGVAPEAIDVPPTIQSLLAARIDRLSPDEQLVLERAAVWGTEFPIGALGELLPAAAGARTQSVLEQLRRKELLDSAGSYWIDEPVYRFHHVLIRDAAYRRMLRDVRASLHEQLASWVDAKTASLPSEYDELVGHHLEQSYRQRCELGPPDDDTRALGRSAAARLGAAAQRALDRDDPAAASLAGRALACLPPDDTTRADLLLIRCDALLTAADAVAARDAVAELERIAAPSPRLRAWATCFAAQLATITDPAHLRETEQRAASVAAELTELGDARGAAKAHAVHAAALARLGRFAEVEDALDRALTRAREADDRRLATVALAAAPVAAVWGPSPVPRAGGRCLDVVRLLRITAGSPVVEATSLRCQGVLESFRGRTDAARRLVGAARESLLELGLVHGLLEAELFAGIVELGAGELAAADQALRRAYDGLRDLGADADAARAGALLARVALERGALGDAEQLAREAQQLAGDDLQAGISWRRVAAEVHARRGEHDEARALAEAAVAIAAQTDALVHHADACMALAAVRRAAGDGAGAGQAAREAANLYERKGATALVEIARASFDRQAEEATLTEAAEPRTPSTAGAPANRCTGVYGRWCQLFAAREWNRMREVVASDFTYDDRRTILQQHVEGRVIDRNMPRVAELYGERFFARALATRGDRVALLASHTEPMASASGKFTSESLLVVETNAHALLQTVVVFSVDDVDAAVAELERRYAEGEGAPFAEMLELIAESTRAFNTHDWNALRATYSASISQVDNSNGGWASSEGRNDMFALAADNATDNSNGYAMVQVIHACTAHAAVATALVTGSVAEGGAVERSTHLVYHRHGAAFDRLELFEEDDLEGALAAYRKLVARESRLANRCTQVYAQWAELFAVRDWRGMTRVASEAFVLDDRRQIVGRRDVGADALADPQWYAAEASATRGVLTPLAVRGDRLAVIHTAYLAADGSEAFNEDGSCVFELGDDDRLVAGVAFSAADFDAAIAELDRRYIAGDGAPFADMLQLVARGTRACNDRDWDELRVVYAPEIISVNAGFAAGWGTSDDREALLGAMAQMFDVFENARVIVRNVVACSADAIVCATAVSAANADGGATEAVYHIVYHRTDVTIDRMEIFDDDHLDEALDAYRRLTTTINDPTNRCVDGFRRWADLFAARDWDALSAVVAEDFVFDDRRPITRGQDGNLVAQHLRLLAEEFDSWAVSVVAVRGERLALITMRGEASTSGSDTFAAATLAVIEIDNTGRFASLTAFELDEVETALAELDRRYIEGEGVTGAATLDVLYRGHAAYNAGDWTAMAECYAPDVVLVDRVSGGWASRQGRDEVFAVLRQLVEGRAVMRAITACSDRAVVYTLTVSAADVELELTNLMRRSGNQVGRMEVFGADELDAAMAAFRALDERREPANRATDVLHRWAELFATRQWDVMRGLVVPDLVLDDRRPIVGMVGYGRDAGLNIQLIAEQGVDRLDIRVIGVRGERLTLVAARGVSDEAGTEMYAAETLSVVEIDAHDRLRSFVGFAPDEIFDAEVELERRFIAGEGAPYADLLASGLRQAVAVNARDWASARREYAPDITVVDHYTAGWSELRDADDVLEALRSIFDTMPGAVTLTPEIHALRADAMVNASVLTAPGNEGERVELVFLNLMHFGPQGIDHIESWPDDRLDEALAAFHALGTTRTDDVSNRCTEVFARWTKLFADRDFAAMRAVAVDDFVLDDRRRIIATHDVGHDVRVHMELLGDEIDELAVRTIAVRGERLALIRTQGRGREPGTELFAYPTLGVIELADDDRIASFTALDPDDLDIAISELNERYLRGDDAGCASVLRAISGLHAAYNARDWGAVRAACATDVALVDHRPASWGAMNLDGIVDTLEHLFVPDARMTLRKLYETTPEALLGLVVTAGHDSGGAVVESSSLVVVQLSPDGIARLETFAVEALGDAQNCYRALGSANPSLYAVENRCTTSKRQLCLAVVQRDWDAVRRLYSAPRHQGADRRRGVRSTGNDPVDNYRATADLGLSEVRYTPIAIRGERLALGAELYCGAGDGAVEVRLLTVNEVDANGRFVYAAAFDVDDLDGALADLEDRYVTGEGAGVASTWSRVVAGHRAMNARDWDAFAAGCTVDVVTVDHTYGGWTDRRGREAYVEALAGLAEPFPETRSFPVDILAISEHAAAYVLGIVERAMPGYLSLQIGVVSVTPAGFDRVETFPATERAAALEVYERLLSRQQRGNSCTRAGDRLCELFARRDWDTFGALFAPDFDGDDYRRGFTSFDADPVKSFGTIVDLAGGGVEMELRPIAVRGDRLALAECWMTGDAEFALEPGLFLTEIDGDERLIWMASYDIDAHDRAFADLDRRFVDGEAAAYREIVEVVGLAMRAVNERDWVALRELFASDIIDVDHYAAEWGSRVGVDGTVAAIQELLAGFPNAHNHVSVVHAIAPDALVATTVVASQDADGGRAEMEFHVVYHFDPRGRIDHIEVFSADALTKARACFASLASSNLAGVSGLSV
jgi:class 3 adenylate cyclase/tetratricopeptide (TPR) repeat protein